MKMGMQSLLFPVMFGMSIVNCEICNMIEIFHKHYGFYKLM